MDKIMLKKYALSLAIFGLLAPNITAMGLQQGSTSTAKNNQTATECLICMQEIRKEKAIPCSHKPDHLYHPECITRWMTESQNSSGQFDRCIICTDKKIDLSADTISKVPFELIDALTNRNIISPVIAKKAKNIAVDKETVKNMHVFDNNHFLHLIVWGIFCLTETNLSTAFSFRTFMSLASILIPYIHFDHSTKFTNKNANGEPEANKYRATSSAAFLALFFIFLNACRF